MKLRKKLLTVVLITLAVFAVGFEVAQAAKESLFTSPRIAIVSLREVFENCGMKSDVEKQLASEGEEKYAELQKLEQEITDARASLSKRKPGTEDYLDLLKTIMLKQADLETKQEFYQQAISFKEIRGKEKIYRKILDAVSRVAKQKNLDMVINRDDNYLNMPEAMPPPQSPSDFVMTTKTHKLLYYDKQFDITSDVLEEIEK